MQLSRQDKDRISLTKPVKDSENRDNWEEVKRLKKEVNKLEQYGRKQNPEVHGLLKSENKSLLSRPNDLAEKLSLSKLNDRDVEATHRLPSKPIRS